ncbi:hypothetical protein HMPREF3100_03535 [Enterococcus sp. HMSC29A04]|uniref:hypothetical protein n=1 Tax=unclassified Enterococcus TaxID=2608891 RepID=UPI0007F4ED5B|nr:MULTISPECIES: hypothetical protein [unclassified Enterococcus]OFT89239.1 hypothetical protein HMPREF3100_03535 [Enterococcus sp. HMSC29A04]OFU63874.1 hypothetical protein HMPREF3128_10090 [Enterococcus sp. HMSC14A10]SBA03054.1 hypothetical protein DTPHA_1403022 [Enterococcus faecium]
MRFLEIIKRLGDNATNEQEKEPLGAYFKRLRQMVREDCSDDEVEHRFCLMITCYILRYVTKQVDYSKTNADYYLTFLTSRLNVEVPT